MKRYKHMPDTRPLDVWGNPIGKPYEKKDWAELSPEEMIADFEWKSDVLDSFADEINWEVFYKDYLFRDLCNGELNGDYKILLTQYDAVETGKVHKIDVDEIQDYLHLSDVALSPCLFYKNWRRKDLMNYVTSFVLDIDKLRPMQLQRFFLLFEEGRLLTPTFIANSGSGVHFYYLLDHALRCDSKLHEANNLIATEIYKRLYDDVIFKEKYKDAQRHWLGQDYRVVNSKTKLNLTSQIFKTGDVYTIENLIKYYDIKIDPKKKYASKKMIKYAKNIAKDLSLDPPDFENTKETYDFINAHKDAAYDVRENRRAERRIKEAKRGKRKSGTWYKNTLWHMQDNTEAGYRFSSMKALAIIAFKEKVPKEIFLRDIEDLAEYWKEYDWNGDDFNTRNIEAIERLYDNAAAYSNTSAETLEEWLGYEFKRVGNKRNGRKQDQHVKVMTAVRDVEYPDGTWRNKDGRPSAGKIVKGYRDAHPEARKADCIRDTGLSKPTVYKWWEWDGVTELKQIKNTNKTLKPDKENKKELDATVMAASILQNLPEEKWDEFIALMEKMATSEEK